MAVSGRKMADLQGSISKGSAEDFDHSCEPCLAIGQHLEAHGYCLDCQEYLCKNCFAYHQRIKATKNHQLLDKGNMNKHSIHMKDSALCTEACHLHKNEIIKFFCTDHEILGCTDCITLNHRTCKIDYIPDKCEGIGDSEEYTGTMKELEERARQLDDVMEQAITSDNEIDTWYEYTLKEIHKFRKEINDHLDKIQEKILADIDKKKLADKQIVQKVHKECANISTAISKLQSDLQDSKTSKQHGQLYINIKNAKTKMKEDKVHLARKLLAQRNTDYKFERSKDLESIISKQKIFGTLSKSTSMSLDSPVKQPFDKLKNEANINLKTKSDCNECYITGCAVISPDRLILIDRNNYKVKVVDIQRRYVSEEMSLGYGPWDIVTLPNNQFAVTMPMNEEIFIMTAFGKPSIVRKIPVKGECKGITYHQDSLYVVSCSPITVVTVDLNGNNLTVIPLESDLLFSPTYIQLSQDFRSMYISDSSRDCVVNFTLQGEVLAVYSDLQGATGMVRLDDGSLLVCCRHTGAIYHIWRNMKQDHPLIENLQNPLSISYKHHQQEFYVSGLSDQLQVLKTN